MKIDMHCHTSEGSLDASAEVKNIVYQLRHRGFDGLLITDHNSYKGYYEAKKYETKDFKIFKGIEYDSFDAGHIIVIIPENEKCKEFETRGMRLGQLSKLVHERNGVLGLAHPFDHGPLGALRHRKIKKDIENIMKYIDFVEIFNSSASSKGNTLSQNIAHKYNKATTGGSDCHRNHSIGLGYCECNDVFSTEDLIKAVKENKIRNCNGEFTQKHFIRLKHVWFNFITTPYYLLGQAITVFN